MDFSPSQLEDKPYRDLQELAKSHGIRANQKSTSLIKELQSVQKAPRPDVVPPTPGTALAHSMQRLSLTTPKAIRAPCDGASPTSDGAEEGEDMQSSTVRHISFEVLRDLKYNDLRSLAKQMGTPAKGKAQDIIEAILAQHDTQDEDDLDYEKDEDEYGEGRSEIEDTMMPSVPVGTPRKVDAASPHRATVTEEQPEAMEVNEAATDTPSVLPVGSPSSRAAEAEEVETTAQSPGAAEAVFEEAAATPPHAGAPADEPQTVVKPMPVFDDQVLEEEVPVQEERAYMERPKGVGQPKSQPVRARIRADEAKLYELVESSGVLSFTADERRVVCSLTGHEIVPDYMTVLKYLGSKKIKHRLQHVEPFNIQPYRKHFITEDEDPAFLLCELTDVQLYKNKMAVDKHISGHRYQEALAEWRQQEEAAKDKENNPYKLQGVPTPKGVKTVFTSPGPAKTPQPVQVEKIRWTYEENDKPSKLQL